MENTNNKRKIYILIIIGALLLTVIGVSFAFFIASGNSDEAADVTVNTEGVANLTFTPGVPINIVANQENFADGSGSLSAETISSATLKSPTEGKSVTDSYNIYFEVTNNTFVYSQNSTNPEMILTITDPGGNILENVTGLNDVEVIDHLTGDVIKGFDVTTFKGLIVMSENYAITANTKTGTTQEWKVKLTFVNLDANQILNEGKNFESTLYLQKENKELQAITLQNYLIKNLNENEGFYQHVESLEYSAADNNYRFSGSDDIVNNYITFNNESWRIVGIYNDLVKIVRDNSLGNYVYDTSEASSWEGLDTSVSTDDAEINQLLNIYYLNSLEAPVGLAECGGADTGSCDFAESGISELSKNMIQTSKYYNGAIAWNTNLGPKGYYDNEIKSQTFNNYHISTIYPSDYLYAANNSYWNLINYQSSSSTNDYAYNTEMQANNWLFTPYISSWTLINTSNNQSAWVISLHSNVSLNRINLKFELFPVLMLKSNVKLTGGTGTKIDPFQISI